jgi:uncharacterized protein YjiS (DUF1127 family)
MHSARTMPIPSGHPAGVFDAVKAVWVGYRRDAAKRQELQSAMRELSQLDDVALADIGIFRGQIPHVVMSGRR